MPESYLEGLNESSAERPAVVSRGEAVSVTNGGPSGGHQRWCAAHGATKSTFGKQVRYLAASRVSRRNPLTAAWAPM